MADKPPYPGVFDDIPEAETLAPPRRDPPFPPPQLFGAADEDLRVGPYEVFKVLADAPGAKMLEARDAAGQQRLLQLAHVRAPRSGETTRHQLEYLKLIADRTKEMQGEPEVRVLAHGAVERSDGSQLLYWTLPWREGATRLGHAAAHIQSLAHLCAVAISLVERTRERHEKGRVDPLLCEELVIIRPGAGASVAGVPLHLPPDWLADDMVRARYAPEEMLRHEPLKAGDLWRLGLTLRGISSEVGELPSALRRVFDALADPDPALRMSSAAEASSELKKLHGQFQAAERASEPGPRAPSVVHAGESDTWPEGKMVPVNPVRAEPEQRSSDLPLASMRPVLSQETGVLKMADAPTMLDVRPPGLTRAKAAANLEAIRKKVAALDPNADPNDTLIDVGPPAMAKFSSAKIDDIGRAKMPFGQSGMVTLHSLKLQFLDPVEMAASVEDIPAAKHGIPSSNTAWDRAKARADALKAGFEVKGPMGPGGTLVGLRRIGPAGTVVGAKPRARELLAKAAADVHNAPRALPPPRMAGPYPDPASQPYGQYPPPQQPGVGPYGTQPYLPAQYPPQAAQQLAQQQYAQQLAQQYAQGQYPQGYPPGAQGQYPQGQPYAQGQQYAQGQYPQGPQYAQRQYPQNAQAYPQGQYPQGTQGQYPQGAQGQYPQGQYPQGAQGQYPQNAQAYPQGQYPQGAQGQYPQGAQGQYPQGQYSPNAQGQYPQNAQAYPQGQYPQNSQGQYPQNAQSPYAPHSQKTPRPTAQKTPSQQTPLPPNNAPQPRRDTELDPGNQAPGSQPHYAPHRSEQPQYVQPPQYDAQSFDPRRALPPGPAQPVAPVLRPITSDLVPAGPAPLAINDNNENRPPTVVGVPSLKFRGREGSLEGELLLESGQSIDPANAPTSKEKPANNASTKPRRAGKTALQALMIAALSGAATFAVVKLLPRLREEPRAKITREITALGDVQLEAMPREAIVVTEDDGKVLGKSPLSFLVPPNTAIPVLIAAPGHEPQRLLLPARGRVNVTLLPLDETSATPCEIELKAPPLVRLEAVSEGVQLGPRAKIPGAALVRGADSGGAWIVLCPSLGGAITQILPEHITPRSVEIDLLEPSPASAYVDGEAIGKVPVKKLTTSGFKVVRIELESANIERWVPIFADTILRMPPPKKN